MMKKQTLLNAVLIICGFLFSVTSCMQDHKIGGPEGFVPDAAPFVTGLKSPLGLADDTKGNIWVTEAGSGEGNDGQVTLITPDGKKYPVITGFLSKMSPENSPEGLNHLLYHDGSLYILHGVDDMLYIADVSKFVPGVTEPMKASSLTGEDIGKFVRDEHPNAPDDKDSNPYNMTFGPDGDLFIVDAGGNAVVRRNKNSRELSIYAVLPDVPNPTKPLAGPPTIDAVPTGIVFDGTNLFVTTLVGFPFPAGLSNIYKIDTKKTPVKPEVYKSGFSEITDIIFSPNGKLIVTEFGFSPAGGRIASGEDATISLLAPAITPVDLLLSTSSADTYYALYYGPGLIMKLTASK
ncbi:ScyD/ScyE family protein [Dyadobacter sp. CY312]|uniref:ScyD/ScyE family protein n=1 Tax=Dyadobacter sp. CY312 TaxID=2907303 RepID=UPI001F1988EA|nr:ScyD/ScyE family protein [Dyadobacter sp. CY312]MCE7040102.1 ScyD/ScyE family protein [Dyadobacter sp. CY312]